MNCTASLIAALLMIVTGAFAQQQDEPSIIIGGIIEARRLTVTAADIGKLQKKTLRVKTTAGISTFEGVALRDVLELAGLLFGERLQGARLLAFVVVEGAPPPVRADSSEWKKDDYRALFSLPELDSTFSDRQPIILAITEDGKRLNSADGPYRII